MPLTRRHLLANTASLASLAALEPLAARLGFAQTAAQTPPPRAFPPPPVDNTPPKPPSTRAAKALYAAAVSYTHLDVYKRQ